MSPRLLIALLVVLPGPLSLPSRASAQLWGPEVIGTPAWNVVDVHVFAGPTGKLESGFEEYFARVHGVLPPPNHSDEHQGLLPGEPHPAPYDQEIADGLAALGIVDAFEFTEDDFWNGRGVYFIYMVVPAEGAVQGSSADFPSGPIIPRSLLPLHLDLATRKGPSTLGILDYDAPEAETAQSMEEDGYSHIPMFNADSAMFYWQVTPKGIYEYAATLTDAAGNGWTFGATFKVGMPPDPPAPDDPPDAGEAAGAPDAGIDVGPVGGDDDATDTRDTGDLAGDGTVIVDSADGADVGIDAHLDAPDASSPENARAGGCSAGPTWAPPAALWAIVCGLARRRRESAVQ